MVPIVPIHVSRHLALQTGRMKEALCGSRRGHGQARGTLGRAARRSSATLPRSEQRAPSAVPRGAQCAAAAHTGRQAARWSTRRKGCNILVVVGEVAMRLHRHGRASSKGPHRVIGPDGSPARGALGGSMAAYILAPIPRHYHSAGRRRRGVGRVGRRRGAVQCGRGQCRCSRAGCCRRRRTRTGAASSRLRAGGCTWGATTHDTGGFLGRARGGAAMVAMGGWRWWRRR